MGIFRILLILLFILLLFMFGYYVGKNKNQDNNPK
jgi:uncharacterized membrane protein